MPKENILTVSVIIPVKNGEATLAACLQSIRAQTIGEKLEIFVLDSGSNDNSLKIAESFGAKIIDIEPGTFSHGGTRNIGAQAASGDLLYYTVQDSRMAEPNMLERMAAHFNDPNVQAVNGIQGVAAELDKNPAVWFQRFSKPVPEVRYFPNHKFAELPLRQQMQYCNWDNVNAMYRREALLQLPFRPVNFAEDALWALDALNSGFKIIRDSSLLVYHYHHHSFTYTFRVIYIINYGLLIHFNNLPVLPNILKAIAVNTYSIFKKEQIGFLKKMYWIGHNVVRHTAHLLSALTFRTLHLLGLKAVEKGLKIFCATVPQGRQTNNLSQTPNVIG